MNKEKLRHTHTRKKLEIIYIHYEYAKFGRWRKEGNTKFSQFHVTIEFGCFPRSPNKLSIIVLFKMNKLLPIPYNIEVNLNVFN